MNNYSKSDAWLLWNARLIQNLSGTLMAKKGDDEEELRALTTEAERKRVFGGDITLGNLCSRIRKKEIRKVEDIMAYKNSIWTQAVGNLKGIWCEAVRNCGKIKFQM